MNILIVDDSRLNLRYATDVITRHNIPCNVITIDSPIEALNILKKDSIDIVLLDIVMPEMTGLELLEIIREDEHFKELVILMFTSLSDKSNLQKSFELGANDYITKPIEEIEFISRIKAAIRLKTNQKEIANALTMLEKQNNQLKSTTLKLRETQFQLIQKEKLSAIGSLAGGIAHEINNPLGYLSSNYESLKKYVDIYKGVIRHYKEATSKLKENTALSEDILNILNGDINFNDLDFINSDIDELLNDSNDGIQRVSSIVKRLLNFSNSNVSEALNFNDLEDIINEIITILGKKHSDNVIIEKKISTNKKFLCNRGEITQVFFNIIQNAIQAIEGQHRNSRGHILINLYDKEDYIFCEITDDGPGIPEDALNKIFNPFFTTKDVGEGTGLGLSVCYDLITNKYKGEIDVKSEAYMGSTFIVKLPFQS